MLNTECIQEAAKELNIPFTVIDDFGDFIRIDFDHPKFFIQAHTPFNSDSISCLSKDKEFFYRTYRDELNVPKTIGYVDPEMDPDYNKYVCLDSLSKISADINANLNFPLIIKMNRGSKGHNVFLCKNNKDILRALKNVFNKEKRYYDRVAIAQEYVDIKNEYRIIWFKGDIVLAYEKICNDKKENLSPFHNEESKAVLITNIDLIKRFKDFLENSDNLKRVEYSGIDLVIDKDDNLHVLELNSYPGFTYFIRDNGKREIIDLYKILLNDLKKNA